MAKLPNFKKKCKKCGKFTYIKGKWIYCMQCWEKENGKYEGEDRYLYVTEDQKEDKKVEATA